jgi:hypothetical protein
MRKKWWNEGPDYERTHEIAFAWPRALSEARMIAETDKARLRTAAHPSRTI